MFCKDSYFLSYTMPIAQYLTCFHKKRHTFSAKDAVVCGKVGCLSGNIVPVSFYCVKKKNHTVFATFHPNPVLFNRAVKKN